MSDDSINYADLEAAYESVKYGTEEPTLAFLHPKMYWAIMIDAGVKVPRKLKKWAIGTRRSRRRRELKTMRWVQKMNRKGPERMFISFYKEDLRVTPLTEEGITDGTA